MATVILHSDILSVKNTLQLFFLLFYLLLLQKHASKTTGFDWVSMVINSILPPLFFWYNDALFFSCNVLISLFSRHCLFLIGFSVSKNASLI